MAVTVKHWAAVGTPAETVTRPVAHAPRTPIYEALLHEWSRDGRTLPGEESGPSPSPWPQRRDRYDTAPPHGARTAHGVDSRRTEAGSDGEGTAAATTAGSTATATPGASTPSAAPLPAEVSTSGEPEAGWQRIGTLRPSPRPTTARAALPAAAAVPSTAAVPPASAPEPEEQRTHAGTVPAGTE